MTSGISLPVFREEDEDFGSFMERLDCYFTVKDTADDKKVQILIVSLQPRQYQVLKDLVAPETPVSKTYDCVTSLLKKHYGGTKNPRVERTKFRQIVRREGESLQSFSVRLKHASRYCEFGNTLNQMLVDQLIAGVRSRSVANKLLECNEGLALTFDKALQVAEATEINETNATMFARSSGNGNGAQGNTAEVNRVSGRQGNHRGNVRQNFRTSSDNSSNVRKCYRCNSASHLANKCSFISAICRKCKRKGHIAIVCREGKVPKSASQHQVDARLGLGQNVDSVKGDENFVAESENHGKYLHENTSENCSLSHNRPIPNEMHVNSVYDNEYHMFKLSDEFNCQGQQIDLMLQDCQKYFVTVNVNNLDIEFELDTGASVSCIDEFTFRKICNVDVEKLFPVNISLLDYNKKPLKILGACNVRVNYFSQGKELPIVVVKGNRASLLGRNWLKVLKMDWKTIFNLNNVTVHNVDEKEKVEISKILEKYENVFNSELGCLKDYEVSLKIKPDAIPVYKHARNPNYHLKGMVEKELQRLENLGIIKPINFSEWASPTVNLVKSDGKNVRICGDFKETVNPVCNIDSYPLPIPEDIFATLSRGKSFTKLDLSHAYHQLKLSEESQKYAVINTHKGLFAFTRLQYGLNCAVGIFQRVMENVLKDIPHVAIYVDDIVITGPTEEEHLKSLELVLHRLSSSGLKLKRNKCSFMNKEIQYLGHKLSAEGIHASDEKVLAIDQFHTPKNKQELSTFNGMVKYYHRFLPSVSKVMAPLYVLERGNSEWSWGEKESNAFLEAKKLLKSNTLLVHYDPDKPLVLTCDASSYGLGAVLEQENEEGLLKPVSYASRTLSKSEKNYCQTEKEGLSVVWAVSKFHKYLYGRNFQIWTDHKPLIGLLGETKAVPHIASGRIIRWSVMLSGYKYSLKYKQGCRIPNADCLSRFPLQIDEFEPPCVGEEVLLLEHVNYTNVNSSDIQRWTDRDPILAQVRSYVLKGWNDNCELDEDFKPYVNRKNELSVLQGCILWGNRIVVPPQGRESVTEELHDTHPGIVKMKNLARCYVWWPNIDKDLERKVNSCKKCQEYRFCAIDKLPLHPWEFPSKPWSRIHIDYAGPIEGQMYLVVIDAYSKWLEVIATSGCTSKITVSKLRQLFCTHGLPDVIVSDNATCFSSEEFQNFVEKNGIRHITSAPYHPATNGLAENAVKTFKTALKKCEGSKDDILYRFLFDYRIMPHVTTGVPPCELMMKRRLKTRFDLLRPDLDNYVVKKQEAQARNYKGNKCKIVKSFEAGDHVYFKNYARGGPPNTSGIVEECTGPVSCKILSSEGNVVHRHFDQMFKQEKPCEIVSTGSSIPNNVNEQLEQSVTLGNSELSVENSETIVPGSEVNKDVIIKVSPVKSPVEVRRSSRVRKPVQRLDL